jgi:hypothetical protein
MDPGDEIADEVTRVEAVRYLQGAIGHAVGSNLFLLLGGLLWVLEHRSLAVVSVAGAFLLSANGLSIWAWDRLRAYFAARNPPQEETEPTRTLKPSPLSREARVGIQAGAIMTLAFIGLLLLGRLALLFLPPRLLGYMGVGCLCLGNILALGRAFDKQRR